MTRLPAFCGDCGAVYPSPLRAKAPGRGNAFSVPVPCPACGGSGQVPAELFATAAAAVEARRAAGDGGRAWEAFLEAVEDAREGGDALLAEVAGRAPSMVPLARRLPDAPPPVLRGVAAALRRAGELAAAEAPGPARSGPGEGRAPWGADDRRDGASGEGGTDPGALASRALEGMLKEEGVERARREAPPEVAAARERLAATGRNDACPCGSGEKYKDCHWREDLRRTRA